MLRCQVEKLSSPYHWWRPCINMAKVEVTIEKLQIDKAGNETIKLDKIPLCRKHLIAVKKRIKIKDEKEG